jgi:hypothetical protein
MMKMLSPPQPGPAGALRTRPTQAFTLAEMMVALGVFVLMVLGIVFTWLFCLQWDELVCSKLGASEMTRMSFDQLTSDIRSAKDWKIGTASNSGTSVSFTPCTNQMLQAGNAVALTNSTGYAIYYFDTNACQLCRVTNVATTVQILVQNLTNSGTLGNGATNTSMTFHAEMFNGSTNMTQPASQDLTYKYMIVTTMEFAQYQYPLTYVGPGYYYSYYRVQLKAASHCPN